MCPENAPSQVNINQVDPVLPAFLWALWVPIVCCIDLAFSGFYSNSKHVRVHICSLMCPLIEARVLYLGLCLIMMGGCVPCSSKLPGRLVLCAAFIGVVDWQALIRVVSYVIFEMKYSKDSYKYSPVLFCFVCDHILFHCAI